MPKVRAMISSRCETEIRDDAGKTKLSAIREEIKQIAQDETLFGSNIFEVWVSEEPRDVSARESSWNECMDQVVRADVLICLYTGEGGWANTGGDIGICHAELETAINKEPGKVFIVNAENAVAGSLRPTQRDKRFREYVRRLNRFYNKAESKEEIIKVVREILAAATIELAKMGRRESRKGKYSIGEALDWIKMSFPERKARIEEEIVNRFVEAGHTKISSSRVEYLVDRNRLLFKIHGIPSGMNISSAREMVGQPFLHDHKIVDGRDNAVKGPIHVVGVHKGASEQQAIKMLGFPDAVIVEGPFGIYIADEVQKMQIVLLVQCRDSASTRHNVQKLMAWLEESGEYQYLADRGRDRRKIVDVINKVNA